MLIDSSNRSVWPTWHDVPSLTSHHSGVEAPEAECEDFCLDSGAVALPGVWPNKALGIRRIRWDLVRPSVALLQRYPVVFSNPTETQTPERSFNSKPIYNSYSGALARQRILIERISLVCLSPAIVLRGVDEAQHHEEIFQDNDGCRADGLDLNRLLFTIDETTLLFLQHCCQVFLSQWKICEE